MRLNIDCMRAVLQEAETIPLNGTMCINDLHNALSGYTKDEVQYSCIKLYEAGFIAAIVIDANNSPLLLVASIFDITYKGHEFLAKIRDDTRWKGIKKALPAIRDYSIDAINAVANGFASAAISAYFSSFSLEQ